MLPNLQFGICFEFAICFDEDIDVGKIIDIKGQLHIILEVKSEMWVQEEEGNFILLETYMKEVFLNKVNKLVYNPHF